MTTCGRCAGRGWVPGSTPEVDRQLCPVCRGSGQGPERKPMPPKPKFNPPPPEGPFDTLGRAREKFKAGLDEGVICECCGRFGKRYKRKLNSGMARALLWLYGRNGRDWFNLEAELRALIAAEPATPRSGDPAKLRYWDFMEHGEEGYRITKAGERFALGWTRARRHVFVYNDQREGFSEDSTDIREALGDHFDYDELMRATI